MKTLADKFLKYRGGCVVVVNWGKYSDDPIYPLVVMLHWKQVSNAFTRRLKQINREGVSPDDIHLYGHSLGARMVIDAGISFGPNTIATVDGQ
jgi:Lipase